MRRTPWLASSWPGIISDPIIHADGQQIHEHAGAVAQGMNLGHVAVRPMHGHFQSAVAEFSGQVEQLHIEAEARDSLVGKQDAGGLSAEEFESALGVSKI